MAHFVVCRAYIVYSLLFSLVQCKNTPRNIAQNKVSRFMAYRVLCLITVMVDAICNGQLLVRT